jgi:anti-anti-sigma regulatory factor
MLRIRRDDVDDRTVVLILEGRIVGAWAVLLERECEDLVRSGFRVILDFSDVIFISRSGVEALGRLGRAGVLIIDCPPLIAAMLAEEGIGMGRTTS